MADFNEYKGVWVFCEQRQGALMSTDFELVSEARKLADELGCEVTGLLLGDNVDGIAKELGGYGADQVMVCDSSDLAVQKALKAAVEAASGARKERIGVIGDSAGGYLVQMLGATNGEKAFDKGDFTNVSSDVQAVCTIYGISDLTSIGEGLDPAQAKVHASPAVTEALLVHGPAFGKSPGGSILSDREKAMNASSLGHIDGSEPPFLIMHGSGDRLVSPMQSAHLAQALRKAGTDVEYVLVEGAGHGDLPWFQKPVIERVVKFFEKRLGSPAKDAAEGNNL